MAVELQVKEADDLSRLSLLLTDILGDLKVPDRSNKAWRSVSVIRQIKDPKAGGLLWLASQLLTELVKMDVTSENGVATDQANKTTAVVTLQSWQEMETYARFCPPWISSSDIDSPGPRLEWLLYLASSLQNQLVGQRLSSKTRNNPQASSNESTDTKMAQATTATTPLSSNENHPALVLPDHLTTQQRELILAHYQTMRAGYDQRRTHMKQRLNLLISDVEPDNHTGLVELLPKIFQNKSAAVLDLTEEELVQHFAKPHTSQQPPSNTSHVPTRGLTPGPSPGPTTTSTRTPPPTPGYIPGPTPSPGSTNTTSGRPGPEWDILLSMAMKNNAAEIHRLITERGVNPSHSNAVAQSALHIASLWGNVEAVEALLQHKAAVNAQNSMTGATPLHCTAQSAKGNTLRRIECIDLLIANGADVSKPDFFGKTAADYCDVQQDGPLMAQKLQPQRPDLFQALEDANVEKVKALVADNNVMTLSFMGQSPFLYTLELLFGEVTDDDIGTNTCSKLQDKAKWVGILRVLLEAGADVNEVLGADSSNSMAALEGNSGTPLHRVCEMLQVACKNKDTAFINLWQEICILLLQHKANVSPEVEQLLHTACRKGELDFAKILIEVVGIDPNARGRQGMTPLQFAARSGKVDIVQYLLSSQHTAGSIDIDIKDDRGKTALDAARANEKGEIVALLDAFAAKQLAE